MGTLHRKKSMNGPVSAMVPGAVVPAYKRRQRTILVYLKEHGASGMQELASAFGISQASVYTSLEPLVKDGFVRKSDEDGSLHGRVVFSFVGGLEYGATAERPVTDPREEISIEDSVAAALRKKKASLEESLRRINQMLNIYEGRK